MKCADKLTSSIPLHARFCNHLLPLIDEKTLVNYTPGRNTLFKRRKYDDGQQRTADGRGYCPPAEGQPQASLQIDPGGRSRSNQYWERGTKYLSDHANSLQCLFGGAESQASRAGRHVQVSPGGLSCIGFLAEMMACW